MVSIFDVAKYILRKMGDTTLWKLQKLCYYSQAWYLAWYKKPLFKEDFQVWSNGPVNVELHELIKGNFWIGKKNLKIGKVKHLKKQQKKTLTIY